VGSGAPAVIEVVLAPPPGSDAGADDVFDDAVAQRLLVQITRREPDRERAAWRTTITRSAEGMGARSDVQWLVYDVEQGAWVLPSNPTAVPRDSRRLIAAALVDTRRDIVEELSRRGSAVRRVLSDLEVPADKREKLEADPAAGWDWTDRLSDRIR
jgi:hypothetical protein